MDGGRRGARAGAVLAWALAAVLAGAVAWWGVTLVGGQARRDGADVLTSAQVAEALAAQRAAATPTAATASPDVTATPADTPTGTAGPTGTASPGGDVARTQVVTGGQVGAACRGGAVVLLYATPDDGWSVEVGSAGPEHLEVAFRRGESKTEVRTVCVDDVPTSQVESED